MSKTPKNEQPETAETRPAGKTTWQSGASGIGRRQPLAGLSRSPGAKFVIIGIITVLLLIPAMLVWGLVEDRARRAETVAASISQGWGNRQTLNGPYLVVPYTVEAEVAGEGRVKLTRTVTRHAIFSSRTSVFDADVKVAERRKSIYSVPLYHMKSKFTGSFDAPDLSVIREKGGIPELSRAFLAIAIADPAGFRSEVMLKIGSSASVPFEPGLSGLGASFANSIKPRPAKHMAGNASGIHRRITPDQLRTGFEYEIDMALNGSRDLSIVPSARNTSVKLASNWPHPGFNGRFLPETREISDKGFTASWTVPNLARGIDAVSFSTQLPNSGSVIQVDFVKPLKFYQIVSRTLKYAIAFFALTFLAVFILEIMGKRSIHWVQYVLVGLAMVVFYVMLLALAEHVGFTTAYFTSAGATTALIAWYVGDSLGQKNSGWMLAGIMGLVYAVIFLILKEEEYALLAGSLVAFATIGLTMVLTRRVDWSARREVAGSPDADTASHA